MGRPAGHGFVVARTTGSADVRRAALGSLPPTSDTGRTDSVDASTDAVLVVANALRRVGGDL